MSIEITGTENLRRVIREAGEDAPRLLGQALFFHANIIMTFSKRESPVDLGTLRGSGTVFAPEFSPNGSVSVTLGYGGAAAAYARVQHEHTEFRHRVGKAHFLSDPVLQSAPTMGNTLATRMSRLFG